MFRWIYNLIFSYDYFIENFINSLSIYGEGKNMYTYYFMYIYICVSVHVHTPVCSKIFICVIYNYDI